MKSTPLKLITLLFTLIAVVAFGFYAWSLRHPISQRITGTTQITDAARVPNPSPVSQDQLKALANSRDWIVGLNVIKVDFRYNTRATTFRFYKEPAIEEAWVEFLKKGKKAELFGNDESQNQRLVNLINGQFSCVRTNETLAGQVIPTINQFSHFTCVVPIPPGYGDFVGFINVFLRREPSLEEITWIEESTARLSLEMYERDIVKSTKPFDRFK